jgi:hypothetical protein
MTIARAYGPLTLSLVNAELNYTANAINAALFTSTYVPNQDTHRYWTDLSGECTGTNYTAGGVALTGKTASYDGTTNTLKLTTTVTPITFTAVTLANIRYLVLYQNSGTKPLLSYMDFEATYSASAQDVKIAVPTTGLVQLVVA